MFNPSSYDQPIPTHPHMIKIKHSWRFWIIGAKNAPCIRGGRWNAFLWLSQSFFVVFFHFHFLNIFVTDCITFHFFEILHYKAPTDVIICSNFQRMAGIRWRAIKRVLMTLFLRRSSGFFHRVRTWCVSSKLTQCQIFHHTILIRSTWRWIMFAQNTWCHFKAVLPFVFNHDHDCFPLSIKFDFFDLWHFSEQDWYWHGLGTLAEVVNC